MVFQGFPDIVTDGDLLGRVLDTFVATQIRHEIDHIIEIGLRKIFAAAVKATASPSAEDMKHLRWLKAELGSAVVGAVLLHTGPMSIIFDDNILALPIATLWTPN